MEFWPTELLQNLGRGTSINNLDDDASLNLKHSGKDSGDARLQILVHF